MISTLKNLNSWFRDLILDDVDKQYDKPLPYHKKFGSKKDPVERIEERFDEQKFHNRG